MYIVFKFDDDKFLKWYKVDIGINKEDSESFDMIIFESNDFWKEFVNEFDFEEFDFVLCVFVIVFWLFIIDLLFFVFIWIDEYEVFN